MRLAQRDRDDAMAWLARREGTRSQLHDLVDELFDEIDRSRLAQLKESFVERDDLRQRLTAVETERDAALLQVDSIRTALNTAPGSPS